MSDRLPKDIDLTIVWKTPIGGIKTFKAINKDLAGGKMRTVVDMALQHVLADDEGVAEVTILVQRKVKKPK